MAGSSLLREAVAESSSARTGSDTNCISGMSHGTQLLASQAHYQSVFLRLSLLAILAHHHRWTGVSSGMNGQPELLKRSYTGTAERMWVQLQTQQGEAEATSDHRRRQLEELRHEGSTRV